MSKIDFFVKKGQTETALAPKLGNFFKNGFDFAAYLTIPINSVVQLLTEITSVFVNLNQIWIKILLRLFGLRNVVEFLVDKFKLML